MSVGNSLTFTSAQELIQFANTTGRKKVMFGTNFPQLSWSKCIESANQDIRLRDDVKADFFGGNAARVLKLGAVALSKEKL
jgi:predicted TIM-barrel fold metal-dependent hydrolase